MYFIMINELALLIGYPVVYIIIFGFVTYYTVGQCCDNRTFGDPCSTRQLYILFSCCIGALIGFCFGIYEIINIHSR